MAKSLQNSIRFLSRLIKASHHFGLRGGVTKNKLENLGQYQIWGVGVNLLFKRDLISISPANISFYVYYFHFDLLSEASPNLSLYFS